MANEYELIHAMDVSPEANVRRGARTLAMAHIQDNDDLGVVARLLLELIDQIDRDMDAGEGA